MSVYAAYLLGLVTTLLIIVPFWVLSMRYSTVATVYRAALCNQAL